MHPMEADWLAWHLEHRLGAADERVQAACYPVPLRPGFLRRRTRWVFVVVTDLVEGELRGALAGHDVEFVQDRGQERLYVVWPTARPQGPDRMA